MSACENKAQLCSNISRFFAKWLQQYKVVKLCKNKAQYRVDSCLTILTSYSNCCCALSSILSWIYLTYFVYFHSYLCHFIHLVFLFWHLLSWYEHSGNIPLQMAVSSHDQVVKQKNHLNISENNCSFYSTLNSLYFIGIHSQL
jgi:hypothetical protein